MQKPDKGLRKRPLQEVPAALEKLKRVILFHPDVIVQEKTAKYCVCGGFVCGGGGGRGR